MSLEHSTARADIKIFLNSKQVRKRFGGVSDMTLWRWQNDPALKFPKPIKINRRRFWSLDSLEEFEAERAAESGGMA